MAPADRTSRWRGGVLAGLGAVASGVLGAAVLTYLFLTLAARVLGPTRFAPVSTLWALVFIVGPGLFLPVQQELGRLIASQREQRSGALAVRRVAAVAGSLAAVVIVVTVALRGWISERLFGGAQSLLWCFEGAVVAYALMFLARGVFSGLGEFARFGRLVVTESAARLAVAVLLVVAGGRSATTFGAAIALAPLVSSVLITRVGRRTRLPAGTPVSWRAATRNMGWLTLGSLLAQALANGGPIAVQLLAAPSQKAEAGRFLSALVLARVALYLFQAVQATLLPNLAELVARQEEGAFRAALRRLVLVCAVVTVVSTAAAWLLGGPVVRLLFGNGFAVSGSTMAMLTAASGIYVLGAALSGAAIASKGHRLSALAWLAGCVGFLVGTQLVEGLFARVELGYLLGSCVVAAAFLVAIPAHLRRQRISVLPQGEHDAPAG